LLVPDPQTRSDDAVEQREVTKLRKRASQGDAEAQFQLGRIYDWGLVPRRGRNFEEATEWYRKAAAQGHIEAQAALAIMYSFGKGTAVDNVLAAPWYREAAEGGDANAQNNLGVLYNNGSGVALDYDEAVKWFRKAADQGSARAYANLGHAYDLGHGVPQETVEATKWFRRAAEHGDQNGQFAVAYMYHTGTTLAGMPAAEPDQAEALKWCRKSADQGHPSAAYSLGVSYAEGDGVPQDLVEGLSWLIVAVQQMSSVHQRAGYSDAQRKEFAATKDALAGPMAAAQVAEAEHRAKERLRRFETELNF
jgi:TPR repeat protein